MKPKIGDRVLTVFKKEGVVIGADENSVLVQFYQVEDGLSVKVKQWYTNDAIETVLSREKANKKRMEFGVIDDKDIEG